MLGGAKAKGGKQFFGGGLPNPPDPPLHLKFIPLSRKMKFGVGFPRSVSNSIQAEFPTKNPFRKEHTKKSPVTTLKPPSPFFVGHKNFTRCSEEDRVTNKGVYCAGAGLVRSVLRRCRAGLLSTAQVQGWSTQYCAGAGQVHSVLCRCRAGLLSTAQVQGWSAQYCAGAGQVRSVLRRCRAGPISTAQVQGRST